MPLDPTPLAGTVAVVIGGGDGIGAAIGQALADGGATVVLAGRDRDKLARARDAATARDLDVHVATVDVTHVPSIGSLADEVTARFGGPTVLVNSAGASVTKPALEVTADDWDYVHAVSLRGTFFACQAFAERMRPGGYGKIINLGSTWGATVGVGRSTYAAAKAGVHHLTAALAAEWAPLGLRVNAIAPTTTRTPRVEQLYRTDPDRERYIVDRIPLGRIAEPADVTGAALFLAGPASDFVTGHTLFVDGGWHRAK
jgi:NAD(P)-dependent dehydrogenase (short-subunit alcohol dehydrogenase family)